MSKRTTGIKGQEFFRRGDSFYYLGHFIKTAPREVMAPSTFAMITCLAFATEAFLKVLAQLEHGQQPLETHHLRHLFRDLSDASQERLRREWTDRYLPGVRGDKIENKPHWLTFPQSFDEALDKSARAFIDWRYAEGTEHKPLVFHMMDLPALIRRIILEGKPGFAGRMMPRPFNPKTDFVEPKDHDLGDAPTDATIFYGEAPTVDFAIRKDRRADANDGGPDEAA